MKNEKDVESPCFIPYAAHEGEMSRMERANARLVRVIAIQAIVFAIIIAVVTNFR